MTKEYYELHKEEIRKQNHNYYYNKGKQAVPHPSNKKPFDINNFDPKKAEQYLQTNLSTME